MTSLPAPESAPKLTVLGGLDKAILERIGNVDELPALAETLYALAEGYAKEYALDLQHPDVSVVAFAKAHARFRSMVLIKAQERRIYEQILSGTSGASYEDVLMDHITTGRQTKLSRELNQLMQRARQYDADLARLAKRLREPENGEPGAAQ